MSQLINVNQLIRPTDSTNLLMTQTDDTINEMKFVRDSDDLEWERDHFLRIKSGKQVNQDLQQSTAILSQSGAPNENIVKNHLNIALLNVY